MKKLLAVMTLVASLGLLASAASSTTLVGKVGDAMCGAHNTSVSCVTTCFKKGDAPVLVSHGKIYTITNPDTLKDHPGALVRVKGTLDGTALTVSSVHVLHARHSSASSKM